jgi:hypothetical protein
MPSSTILRFKNVQMYLIVFILFFNALFVVRELDVPGDIYERKTYPFEFSTVEMPYETYNGVNVRLR